MIYCSFDVTQERSAKVHVKDVFFIKFVRLKPVNYKRGSSEGAIQRIFRIPPKHLSVKPILTAASTNNPI